MRFKEYEMRSIAGTKNFELVKWANETSCFVLALVEWNENEWGFDIRSIGFRLIEDATPEMMKWLIHWKDYQSFVNGVEVR